MKPMQIKIYKIPYGYLSTAGLEFDIQERGYIELGIFDPDECWQICNWSCWSKEGKPPHLYSDLDVVNSDVIFHNPKDDTYHLALRIGWKMTSTLDEMMEYCKNEQQKAREYAIQQTRRY